MHEVSISFLFFFLLSPRPKRRSDKKEVFEDALTINYFENGSVFLRFGG